MKFPLQSTVTIGKYVASQQRKGERYPLVLMLEPTLACNIACIGCGKIREYESNRARLSVEECIDADLPVVLMTANPQIETATQAVELRCFMGHDEEVVSSPERGWRSRRCRS